MPCADLTFGTLTKDLFEYEHARHADKQHARVPENVWERWGTGDDGLGNDNEVSGMAILKRYEDTFEFIDNHTTWKRSAMQKAAHRAMIQATLRVIFRHDFASNVQALRKMFKIDKIRREVLIAAIRRAGKTVAAAMFCAVTVYVMSMVVMAVFSTGRRASRSFLAMGYKIFCELPGGRERIGNFNQETMTVALTRGTDAKCVLNSFPAKFEIGLCGASCLSFFSVCVSVLCFL